MKSIILMVILNGKKVNKMNAANSGYTPLKQRIAVERYMQSDFGGQTLTIRWVLW